ncbi:hypothetical protein DIS24_g4229 [Lasiodiplodia hormozganensis]|uniref:Uncharacterized protein n=1 Tax=Lasiodiplodia hormozganensis TaxID=869390 RepID=A0AA39YUQ8_9PEZI|nr:hypothetical protein DIS24_g4229 [Lasiodiplodia hormozganensis]
MADTFASAELTATAQGNRPLGGAYVYTPTAQCRPPCTETGAWTQEVPFAGGASDLGRAVYAANPPLAQASDLLLAEPLLCKLPAAGTHDHHRTIVRSRPQSLAPRGFVYLDLLTLPLASPHQRRSFLTLRQPARVRDCPETPRLDGRLLLVVAYPAHADAQPSRFSFDAACPRPTR